MHPVGIAILMAAGVTVSVAPARWAIVGLLSGALYLTQAQQVVVFGFNLYAVRFLELVGFLRVMVRGEFSLGRLNDIDRTLILLYGSSTAVFLLRSTENFAYQIGVGIDAFLCYIAFRGLMGGVRDLQSFLSRFLVLLAPFAGFVMIESLTNRNLFSFMGGLDLVDWFREGRLRCQGTFRHPSLMGTVGASFLPLYIALALAKMTRMTAALGIVSCLAIVYASNSGGPANCVLAGLAGWLLWKARYKMALVRRGIVAAIAILAVTMKAPIWYLPAKASALTGGGGWHRSYLIDVALREADKWWLAGMSHGETRDWFPYLLNSGTADITNQFIVFGLTGGMLAVAIFVLLLVVAFRKLGHALMFVQTAGCAQPCEYLIWGLGVMLAAHISNWLGISYFDQTYVIWFMQLATISSVGEHCMRLAAPSQSQGLASVSPPSAPETSFNPASPAGVWTRSLAVGGKPRF